MPSLRDLGKDQKCSGGEGKFLQPDCPDQALSHSGPFEAWEETSVYVGKPVYVIWGSMSVCSLK